MATDPATEQARREAHHVAARVLRSWPEKTGIDVKKAGIAAELAVEAAWPIIAPLIRRQAFHEAAEVAAYTADAVGHATCAEAVAAAIRGLGEKEN